MAWREIWSETRVKLGISPKVKDDYYKIGAELVKTINADPKLKETMQRFVKPFAFTEYKSAITYHWGIMIPAMFIQWLSEEKKKTITLLDLDVPSLTPEDASFFAGEYSTSPGVQARIRANLIKFTKFLTSRYYISRYPFVGLKVDMPVGERVIVYKDARLEEFFNGILFGAPSYYLLFFRLLLQTGLRPYAAYGITCGDIEYDKPQKDALDRTFYPIFIKKIHDREKNKIREIAHIKKQPDVTYISEALKNDIAKWCDEKGLTGRDYIFKQFVVLSALSKYIRDRRERPAIAARLKFRPEEYILYGLRHTWTSILYAITLDPGDLMDLGGWEQVKIPLTVYRASLNPCEALGIAKKWEIYLPQDKRVTIMDLQGKCERKEPEPVPGLSTVTAADIQKIMAQIDDLQKKYAESERKREELEKRLK